MTTATAGPATAAREPRAPGRPSPAAWLVAAALLVLVAVALSLLVGANPLPPAYVWGALTGQADGEAAYVVLEQRVPRTLGGLAVGAALGAAGAVMQVFTRNPLADPGLLGVNAGAALAVAAGITYLGVTAPTGYMWFACAGALLVSLAVYALGGAADTRVPPTRLTLTGVAVGAVLSGLTTGITLTHPETFDRMRGWSAGSLLERGLDVVGPITPLIGVGLVAAAVAARSLNAVALGPEVARAQGVSLGRTRVLVLGSVALLAGGASAIAGPLTFVGLMVPHLARWTVGVDQRRILLGSVLGGAALVVLSDVVGRVVVLPSEMPVGVVTAFVGAPLLISLVMRRRATAL